MTSAHWLLPPPSSPTAGQVSRATHHRRPASAWRGTRSRPPLQRGRGPTARALRPRAEGGGSNEPAATVAFVSPLRHSLTRPGSAHEPHNQEVRAQGQRPWSSSVGKGERRRRGADWVETHNTWFGWGGGRWRVWGTWEARRPDTYKLRRKWGRRLGLEGWGRGGGRTKEVGQQQGPGGSS